MANPDTELVFPSQMPRNPNGAWLRSLYEALVPLRIRSLTVSSHEIRILLDPKNAVDATKLVTEMEEAEAIARRARQAATASTGETRP